MAILPYKICPNCRENSYSAYELSRWVCPYCGKDISFVPSEADVALEVYTRKKSGDFVPRVFLGGR